LFFLAGRKRLASFVGLFAKQSEKISSYEVKEEQNLPFFGAFLNSAN
jgi:hypothetical protein